MDRGHQIVDTLLAGQRAWADLREVEVCDAGYTPSTDANLHRPLHPETHAELSRSPQRPLGEARAGSEKPAPVRQLHSAHALTCNFFDYWRARDLSALSDAIGLGEGAGELAFAQTRTTDESADDRHDPESPIDVLIEGEGRPTALLTRFTEPYERRAPVLAPGLAGREDEATRPWRELPGCRGLALDLRANPSRFQRLPIASLLAHGAAMTQHYGHRGFRLRMLWYDVPGTESGQLRDEIDRFRMRVGGEIDFDALSFQEVFGRLRPHCAEHRGYTEYLSSRYFPAAPPG